MLKLSSRIVLPFLLSLLLGCRHQESHNSDDKGSSNMTEISGLLLAGEGEEVILEEMGAREYIPMDTVRCDESGNFNLMFSSEKIAFYVLRFGPSGYITLLMEPGESVTLTGSIEDISSYTVQGSPGSKLLQKLSAEHKQTLNDLGSIARKSREQLGSPDYPVLKQDLDHQFDSICASFQDYSISFIQENPGSPAILIALYNLYGQGLPVFHPDKDFEVYNFVDSVLMEAYADLETVKLLHAQITEAKHFKESNIQTAWLKKGEIAPDFVSSRPDGSQMALSDLKGNYVLLDFWASWSNLCRSENNTLLQALKRYGGMKLRILQVSVDDDKSAWTAAIEKDQLDWDHVSDLIRWESPLVDLYGVERIPFNVIIDPAGKVVETDLYGEHLLSKLDQLLNN